MVFFYRPSTPFEPAPVDPFIACQHIWEGWDGSVWDLSHGLSGLALQSGVVGLEMPDPIFYKSRAAGVNGSLYRGHIIDEQDDLWPLKVFSDGGSAGWVAHYRSFFKTLRYDKTGVWSVVQPDGTKRSKRVRFAGLADRSTDVDPFLTGWNVYGIKLAAERPLWRGEPDSRSFEAAGQSAPTGAYVLWIKSSFTLASASITNLGDVDASPILRFRGPSTTATVAVGGHRVTFPQPLGAGQWVQIDTDPTDQMAWDQDGNERSADFSEVDFAQVPPGENVPLDISMTGTGGVDVEVYPDYYLPVG